MVPESEADGETDLLKYNGLVINVARKFGAKYPVKDSWQYAEGWVGLCVARRDYIPARGKFPAFARHCVVRGIMIYLRHWMVPHRRGFLSGRWGDLEGRCDRPLFPDADVVMDAAGILSKVDEKTAYMIEQSVVYGRSCNDICGDVGLKGPTVERRVRRGLRRLREKCRTKQTD